MTFQLSASEDLCVNMQNYKGLYGKPNFVAQQAFPPQLSSASSSEREARRSQSSKLRNADVNQDTCQRTYTCCRIWQMLVWRYSSNQTHAVRKQIVKILGAFFYLFILFYISNSVSQMGQRKKDCKGTCNRSG